MAKITPLKNSSDHRSIKSWPSFRSASIWPWAVIVSLVPRHIAISHLASLWCAPCSKPQVAKSWFLGSGATHPLVGQLRLFRDFTFRESLRLYPLTFSTHKIRKSWSNGPSFFFDQWSWSCYDFAFHEF
jgi:hypothetical protein